MSIESSSPIKPVNSEAVWYAEDMRKREAEWSYRLTSEDVSELRAATARALALDKEIQDISKADFTLPSLGPRLESFAREVVLGRGFQIIRGVPVDSWSRHETVTAYWGIGLHLGRATSNNAKGHLVGHVADLGLDPDSPTTRIYATCAAQPPHTDEADVVALLCLQPAVQGGSFTWASSHAIHNEIVGSRPDLAEALAGPLYRDRKGEVPPGRDPFFAIPAFNHHAGHLSVVWGSDYVHLAQRHPEVPRLTDAQSEAIGLFDRLAADDRFFLRLDARPGDLQILSNHTQVHARSAYVDGGPLHERRHLLRLWLTHEDDRPLPEAYRELLGGSIEVGKRGGIKVDGTVEKVTLEAA